MTCDTEFRPQYLSTPKQIEDWARVAGNLRECFTVPVAEGPGMNGILPARCTAAHGRQPRAGAGWSMQTLSGVLEIRTREGLAVGTGIVLAPDLLLTAMHVVEPSDKETNSPLFAVADAMIDDLGNYPSIVEERGFRLAREVKNELPAFNFVASSPRAELDFALLRIVTSRTRDGAVGDMVDATRHTAMTPARFIRPKWRKPAEGDSVNILAYTANPFFPRGLTSSTHGRLVACNTESDATNCDAADNNFVYYNLQTTPGYSGAPVFSNDFEWVAMHHKGLSVLEIDEALRRGVHRDFSRPNRGVSAEKIVRSIACQLTCGRIDEFAFSAEMRSWLVESLNGCK